ncbi:MAG: TonB-dependent receptor [Arenicella sp.]|nr:TonB-dependent receptor [Arenicella sp.]
MNALNKKVLIGGLVLTASAISFPQTALAQALEEIVVTARKKSESLQSVPITVSAFTEQGLANRGIENSADIGNFIPNVQFDTSSSFAGTSTFQAYIRGIGQSDFAINTDPGVGVYVDGVYYARASTGVIGLLDVERIGVLKGPQGTLFGRNTIGGAVNVITKTPSEELDFTAKLTVGEFDRRDLSVSASIPLSENVFSSFALSTTERDGFRRRIPFPGATSNSGQISLDQQLVTGGNVDDDEFLGQEDAQSFRGKLVWNVNDILDVTLSADYSTSDNGATPTSLLNAEEGTPAGLAGLFNACVAGAPIPPCATSAFIQNETLPFDNRFLTGDIDTTFGTGANFSRSDDYGFSVTTDWQINDSLALKSITAFRELDAEFGVDIDSSPANFDQTTFTIDQEQFSQEIQLNGDAGRFSYTVGAYYFTEDATQADNVPIAGGLIQVAGDNSQETDSVSLFGETTFSVNDTVDLVFGLRYTDEEKTLNLNQRSLNPEFFISTGFPLVAFPRADQTFLGPEEPQVASFTNTSGRLGVNWQVNENVFTYVSFSQGYKSGGFTTRLTAPFNAEFGALTNGLTNLEFDEETVDSLEFGIKTQLFNNLVRLNASIFFNTYEDIQIVVQRGVSPANENAGAAEINGFEIELEALPTNNLSVIATFGYTDAEYTELDPLLATTPFGAFDQSAKLPNTPETTASIALNWTLPKIVQGDTTLNVNYSFTDEVFNDTENTPLLHQDSTNIWNASMGWTSESDKWDIRLGVNNLSDERRLVSGFNSGALNFVVGSFNRPREWYFTVGYNY